MFISGLMGQEILRQSIRGVVIDQQTQTGLPGATILIPDTDPIIGTSSDANGHFKLSGVPIGRHELKVTYIGYKTYQIKDLLVTSSKELVILVELEPQVIEAGEVVITAESPKTLPVNRMALVSVKPFTIEETYRFAGTYNDPARMAAQFAGVTSGIDNRNDIIIRGNSPMGLQWRVDGIEIPNPNHFGALGTTGGPVTILNNNLMGNSDFITGVYPAEYSNALSGVFDARMRNGNNEHHEHWFQVGWNGLEFGTEGPFSKKHTSSYLLSYRYSLLALLKPLGIDVGVVPKYQDLNFRLVFSNRQYGTFTITGIGGISYIELFDERKTQNEWTFLTHGENISNGSDLYALGVAHQIPVSGGWMVKSGLSFVGSKVYTKVDSFSLAQPVSFNKAGELSQEYKVSGNIKARYIWNKKNTIETGLLCDLFQVQYADSLYARQRYKVNTHADRVFSLIRGFAQWKNTPNDQVEASLGINIQYLTLNQTWSPEPRLALNWRPGEKHTLSLGAGIMGQMQPRIMYFVVSRQPDSSSTLSNLSLRISKNAQVVAGYDYLINENLHVKAEAYYQYLYHLPVKKTLPAYCMINYGHDFFIHREYTDSLVNKGTGENYGLELTMEKFFHRNYYFLVSASLYHSTYFGYDSKQRNTAFNGNYVLNALGGYEFRVGKRKWGILSFDLRATWAGGNPYVPWNSTQTVAAGTEILDWERAYQARYPDYKRVSLRFGIKRNKPGYTLSFFVDLQYRTNYTNVYLERIDVTTGEIRKFFKMGFFPMGNWRIEF